MKKILAVNVVSLLLTVLFWNQCFLSYTGNSHLICSPLGSINFAAVTFIWSLTFFLVTFVLIFVSNQVVNYWWKFARFYVVLVVIITTLTPSIDSSILGFDKKFMSWFLASIFLITSLILIAQKWWKGRKQIPA